MTWWGALLLAALDSSAVVFLPYGVDAVVIYLSARNRDLFWLYPLIATTGSTAGAAATYWAGKKIGEKGLGRFIAARRLERLQKRVETRGALAIGVPAILPPPFPLTPFILISGALGVDAWRFFAAFASVRMLRFGIEGVLARRYGEGILSVLQSDTFRTVIVVFVVIAVAGTAGSLVVLWKKARR